MKTKHETKESSVALAFAELGRLERERADAAAAKQALREALQRQGRELAALRERFEAERSKMIAKARRERARRQRIREQLTARLIAEAEAAHDERLALVLAELEAKRLRLAAVEAADCVPSKGRRALEWSVPIAAAALVGFLGFTMFDDEAVARTATVEQVNPTTQPAPEPEPAPEPTPEPKPEAEPPAPEPTSEPDEAKPETKKPAENEKSTKKRSTKKQPTSKKSTSKKSTEPKSEDEPETKPVIKKNSKPLELGDFDGNPLG